jgi:radical SAM protein with 4Fe4S-binding SPASM domain
MRKVDDETVLACAQKLIDNGIIQIVITGGEPLLNKDLVKKIITLSNENRVIVSVNTNLTLLDNDFLEFLIQTETRILTSCPSAVSSSFEKLTLTDNYTLFENNVKKLVAANLKIGVNMVVTKDNLHEIRVTAEKMKKLGCHSFDTTPMALNMEYPRLDLLLSAAEVRQMIDDLLWAEKTFGLKVNCLDVLPKCLFSDKILSEGHLFLFRKCQAGRSFAALSCNGDVRPCANNTISYGNILEDELKTIWERMSDWRSMQYVPKKCEKCTWLNRCLGGCRTNAKIFSGKWNGEDVWGAKPLKTQPPLHKKQIELQQIELNDDINLQINSEYLYRQEYENVFVIYNIKNNISFMINKEYFDFIQRLEKYEVVTFGELKKQYNVTDKNKAFHYAIKFLVQCKILKPIV